MDNKETSSGQPEMEIINKAQIRKDNILMYLHDFVVWLVAILLVFLLLFRVVVVSGGSMNDTLIHGDYLLLLNNVLYSEPKQGDIIVAAKTSFKNGEPIIKRVIATEGQWVDIDFEAGIVYVNGTALEEPYIKTPTNAFEGVGFPLMVEDGCIFVMGDNRNESKDSRSLEIGLIDEREILGKAIFLFLPGFDEESDQMNFKRIGALS
jgi:signal peptidase I